MLKEYLSTLANKLRSVLETTEKINAQNFVDKIQDVYSKGYTEGDFNGYQSGYENGFREGEFEGYEKGKQEGQLSVWNASESLQGNVSGVAISVNDVSPIEHSVKCSLSSKNRFLPLSNRNKINLTYSPNTNIKEYKETDYYISISANNYINSVHVTEFSLIENGFTFNGTSNSHLYGIGFPLECGGGETFTVSWKDSENGAMRCGYYDENYSLIDFSGSSESNPATFTTPTGTKVVVIIFVKKDSSIADSLSVWDIQVEAGSTATEYTPYTSNFEGVEVTCCGKNLCKELSTENTPSLVYRRIIFDYFPKGEYTIFSPDTPIHFYAFEGCQASSYKKDSNGVQYGVCFNVLTGGSISIGFRKTDETLWVDGTKVMLVQGNIEYPQFNSLYEDYKGQTVKVGDNGIVDGIKSISPNMTLLSNNGAVSINAKYYKDPDIVISNLQQAVALTGGE